MKSSDSTPSIDEGPRSLAELEARLRRDFELLVIPPGRAWIEPRVHAQWGPLLDVAVIGAGMAGLSAALALKRRGVRRIGIFDRSPAGFEGPWATYARMETLRSPPELAGPSLGIANLTFRAWFEAQFGREEWEKVYRIPRLQWMDYLRWYRRMLDVPIENDTELVDLIGDADAVRLTLRNAAGTRTVAARRVILANGRDALGGPYIPPLFRNFDRRYGAHTSDAIDFAALRGKVVGVIGAGASGVDNAAESLEAGAARVAMMARRSDIPRVNKGKGIGSPGVWHGFYRLTPAQRLAIVRYIDGQGIPPPHGSMLRCSRHPNFTIISKCAPRAVTIEDGRVILDTTRGRLAFDFLIFATGFTVDWSQRPEFAALAPHVALWRDRFKPDDDDYFPGDHPFVGPYFEFLEKEPGKAPWVERVYCFTFPAFVSHGPITGDVPGISVGADRVAEGVVGALFAEEFDNTFRRLQKWDDPEVYEDDYVLDRNVEAFRAQPVSVEAKS
jgi:cation diffusion facilitator CzcD-associated flavoprotein CzcO